MPGIGFSPDKMLQARIFSYADAHRYRIGTHYEASAGECAARARCTHYHKDGAMRFTRNDNGNPDAYYERQSRRSRPVTCSCMSSDQPANQNRRHLRPVAVDTPGVCHQRRQEIF